VYLVKFWVLSIFCADETFLSVVRFTHVSLAHHRSWSQATGFQTHCHYLVAVSINKFLMWKMEYWSKYLPDGFVMRILILKAPNGS
jgi:hypothetical protein